MGKDGLGQEEGITSTSSVSGAPARLPVSTAARTLRLMSWVDVERALAGRGGFRQSCRLNTPCRSLPHPGAGSLGGQRSTSQAFGDNFRKTATEGVFKIFFNRLLQLKDYKWKSFLNTGITISRAISTLSLSKQ